MPDPIDHRAFLESTPLVPWEIDPRSGRVTYVGPQAAGFLGRPMGDWIEPTFWARRVLPDDQATVLAARAALAAGGPPHTIEYRMEHADGHLIWVSETASGVSEGGEVVRIRGLLSEVTARKRLEASVHQSEDRLRALLQGAPDAMIVTAADGSIVNMNEQAEYLLGYPLSEVEGSALRHLVPDRLHDRLSDIRAAFDRDPHRRSLVDGHGFAVRRADAEEVPVELSVSPIPAVGGRQFLYALRDLTARRRIESQLRSSESRLRGMASALPAMVSFVDAEQRYRFVNDYYAAWAGRSPEQMEGRLVREVLGESLYERLRPGIEAALTGQAVHFQFNVTAPGSNRRPVDVSYVPHKDGDEVVGYFVVVVDLSEQVARALTREPPPIESRTPSTD